MTDLGVRSPNVAATSLLDTIIGNRKGSSRLQSMTDLAKQLAGTSPINLLGNQAPLFKTSADLAASALSSKISAWVYEDPSAANNGIWRWTGAIWEWALPLPYSFVEAEDVGAGTANAIKAITKIPVSEDTLILVELFRATTGEPATISFNDGSLLTIKTNRGTDASALASGMVMAGKISGSTFRLITDEDVSNLVDQAEAARDLAAESAASIISGLDNRVRYDEEQERSDVEKSQARANLGLGTASILSATAIALLGVAPHFTVNVGIGNDPRFPLDIVKNITAAVVDNAIHHVSNKPALLATDIYSPQVPAGYYYADGIRSVMEVSDDSTVTHTSAFGAYYINKSVQGSTGGAEANAVGYFSLGIAAVNNSATWGLNTALNDNTVNGLATLVGRKLIGWEGDFQVNGASIIQGAALIIQGDGTPAGANGITFSHQVSTTARWQRAFVTGDGSCSVAAMVIGANAVSGANVRSQSILFNYFNASGVEYQQKMLAINGGFNFTTSELADGIYLASGAANPTIGVTGSSASANLNLRAAGTGYVSIANSGTYFASTGELYIGSKKVLGAQDTGWVAMTGSGNKATSYDVSSVTLAQLAGRVAQLQTALTSQGIIGPS
ncbi:hypothetical protein GOZ83_05300 [Agrobacterium vitis]|uniref:hypothetical protein n=1 Tax=Rhizobium/Agrobacterium group TaxID=227290 RepID=UPI0012E96CF9|nr:MULTISPECIES: hypothetical protein [Rhizobium/Agrobacterium group]MCF1492506.1 hypothetical protein [Allorhizobium ampelinum]MVA44498.1 hypothetical protein [Agrobacterium vitis]